MQKESKTKWKRMLCYIFIFCIAGTLGNNQLPALVNNKQHKPSSHPSCLQSGQCHFFLFNFLNSFYLFFEATSKPFWHSLEMLSITVQGHRRCLIFKKKNAETVWEENTDEATNLTFWLCKAQNCKKIYLYTANDSL